MMRDWIGPALIAVSLTTGGLWLIATASDDNGRTEREFKEACAKVNGTAVWNKKYWECLK